MQNGKFGNQVGFDRTYKGKRVFITGHTGFKGSWLNLWLSKLGAEVCGYALAPNTNPNHFDLLDNTSQSVIADIRNFDALSEAIQNFKPDIVFHLAAQPLVRYSYKNPRDTYETNVIGTLNVLEACRNCSSVRAIVCVTTDKVYENHENPAGYLETDRLGGYDPYSASKAASELLIHSHIQSFFNPKEFGKSHQTAVASARGGNVIGGGDWCEDRLIPDIIRAAKSNKTLSIRSPKSVRPWQHVLDCLSGYLTLGRALLEDPKNTDNAWNFGPIDGGLYTVEDILNQGKKFFPELDVTYQAVKEHETGLLSLNCEKAVEKLNWKPVFSSEQMFNETFEWYRSFLNEGKVISQEQLDRYEKLRAQKSS